MEEGGTGRGSDRVCREREREEAGGVGGKD
jgi:hypothetical protein